MSASLSELEVLAQEAAAGPTDGLTSAELHGATVGIGAAGGIGNGAEAFELQELVELLGVDVLADAECVVRFVEATLAGLYAEDLSFSLLLPDDDEPMEQRLSALASWCQSFLAGLAAGLSQRGVNDLTQLPAEVGEIVRDFAAIAELDTELGEDGWEADFVELEEFVKVGTLLIMSLADAGDDPEG